MSSSRSASSTSTCPISTIRNTGSWAVGSYLWPNSISVELGPQALQAEDADLAQAHLRQALAFCREHLAD